MGPFHSHSLSFLVQGVCEINCVLAHLMIIVPFKETNLNQLATACLRALRREETSKVTHTHPEFQLVVEIEEFLRNSSLYHAHID